MAEPKDSLKAYQALKTELLFEQVSRVMQDQSHDWRNSLEMLGFEWYAEEDTATVEENAALPENENQHRLVAYFEGHVALDESLLTLLAQEKNSSQPNYPLFMKYFRKGNERLKALLIFALSKQPTNEDYLWDLIFFHEHQNILKEVILAYTTACIQEQDLSHFERLARNFWYHTAAEGYDALHALRDLFSENQKKKAIIEKMMEAGDSESDIEF